MGGRIMDRICSQMYLQLNYSRDQHDNTPKLEHLFRRLYFLFSAQSLELKLWLLVEFPPLGKVPLSLYNNIGDYYRNKILPIYGKYVKQREQFPERLLPIFMQDGAPCDYPNNNPI